MIHLTLDLLSDPQSRNTVLDHLKGGGLLIYPTDTIYGLGGDARLPSVVERIDRIKNRPAIPYSLALSHAEDLGPLTSDLTPYWPRIRPLLPGPFTFLLPPSETAPPWLKQRAPERIGLRCPDFHGAIRDLLAASSCPWISTSVNAHGQNPLNHPEEIRAWVSLQEERGYGPFLFLDGGYPGDQWQPSTIVDLCLFPPRIIRAGAGLQRITEALDL